MSFNGLPLKGDANGQYRIHVVGNSGKYTACGEIECQITFSLQVLARRVLVDRPFATAHA